MELWAMLKELLFVVGFLSPGGSFPEPLPPMEEQKALRALAEGDEEAKRLLIRHNLRLVAHVAKKFPNVGMETDDLVSIGTIGLIKAVSSFDPKKGATLATYAARCIQNATLSQQTFCISMWRIAPPQAINGVYFANLRNA